MSVERHREGERSGEGLHRNLKVRKSRSYIYREIILKSPPHIIGCPLSCTRILPAESFLTIMKSRCGRCLLRCSVQPPVGPTSLRPQWLQSGDGDRGRNAFRNTPCHADYTGKERRERGERRREKMICEEIDKGVSARRLPSDILH